MLLKSKVNYGIISSLVALNISTHNPSGPGALFLCSNPMLTATSSGVIGSSRASPLLFCLILSNMFVSSLLGMLSIFA